MSCEPVREWLFNADDPARTESAPAIDAHLRECPSCRELQSDLIRVERKWRDLPLPARAESSKANFLKNLSQPKLPARPRPIWNRASRWMAAASLIAVVAAGYLFFGPREDVRASSDVLDQLIDWNLELTEAPSPAERKRIYNERHEAFVRALPNENWSQQERELAESLLGNGAWMVEHDDPVEEIGRYNVVADQLLERVRHAGANAKLSNRFASQFAKINARGIDHNWERIKSKKFDDPDRMAKFNKLVRDDVDRAERINSLMDESPELTRRELRRALELTKKRPKWKK